jgi:hypothetical protein
MNIAYKHLNAFLMLLALVNWSLCFQTPCRGAEEASASFADRIRVLQAEDPGLLPSNRADAFLSSMRTEAEIAGLTVMSYSSVIRHTNVTFTQLEQKLALEATESQLLNFLRNIAASNSPLRVRSISLRPASDHSRLRVGITITGDYRLPATGQSQGPASAQAEYLLLNERRQLRQAALDCYELTKSTLPPSWSLDGFSFADGKKLSLQGEAPANQASLLEDVKNKFEKTQTHDDMGLFVPSSGTTAMRIIEPDRTKSSWSMSFELQMQEPR